MSNGTEAYFRDAQLRRFIRACAMDPRIVARFNEIHGTSLDCPIRVLVDPVFPTSIEDSDLESIALFIIWARAERQKVIKGAIAHRVARDLHRRRSAVN